MNEFDDADWEKVLRYSVTDPSIHGAVYMHRAGRCSREKAVFLAMENLKERCEKQHEALLEYIAMRPLVINITRENDSPA